MIPAQTSFIPITVALTRWIEADGFGGNYPFWYLGTTPVKYLTGPVAPGILIGVHKVLPGLSLFDLSLFLVFACQLLVAFGWGMLAWKLSGRRSIGAIGGVGVFLAPWHWVSGLGMGEVSGFLASALTPWLLLVFYVYLTRHLAAIKKRSANLYSDSNLANPPRSGFRQHQMVDVTRSFFGRWLHHVFDLRQGSVFSIFAFTLLLLTNTTASIPAVFGILILGAIQRKWKEGLKKGLLVIFLGWALSLWWYGLGFWWTTLSAPSIGGSPVVISFVNLFNLLRGFVPVILAVLVVRWGIRPKTDYGKFTFTWLLLFGSLTLFRFMADPDFWMDWVSWMGEVEVGVALLAAKLVQSSNWFHVSLRESKVQSFFSKSFLFFSLAITVYLIGGWIAAVQNRGFWLPRQKIDNTVEYKIAEELKGMVRVNDTVFLSGTTAFWLNSLIDIRQVRGGRDEASVDKRWREVAWEVREGVDGDDSAQGLKELGVDYLVVHTDSSREFYHDFSNIYKFDGLFEKVSEHDGDAIYRLKY